MHMFSVRSTFSFFSVLPASTALLEQRERSFDGVQQGSKVEEYQISNANYYADGCLVFSATTLNGKYLVSSAFSETAVGIADGRTRAEVAAAEFEWWQAT
ncbi:hypothetical protein N7488_001898 [Penicillium malachiteum]|nr:hypothetical protein N7488_001898 [Penicillium malachiteum]